MANAAVVRRSLWYFDAVMGINYQGDKGAEAEILPT